MADLRSDSWGAVGVAIRRRGSLRIAFALLMLISASAIYAPLVANDRPYILDAVDHGAYDRARRTLVPAARALSALAGTDQEEYLAGRREGSTRTRAEAIEGELQALRTSVASMKVSLPEERFADLDAFLALAEEVALLPRAGAPLEAAQSLAEAYRARPLQGEDGGPGEGGAGLELVPHRSFPLFASLSGLEVFFMVLLALGLTAALRPRALERARLFRTSAARWGLVLGLSTAVGLGWQVVVGGGASFHSGSKKAGLTSGEVRASFVLFPPLNFGFAETHLSEKFLPPTLTSPRSAERSAEVEQRAGEPAVDSRWRHPLGTDAAGRDLLARILWGGRISLAVGLTSTAILTLIGTLVGATAGYVGGRVDWFLSRWIDAMMSVPAFFLIVAAAAFVDPDAVPPMLAIVLLIAVVRWTGIARLTRAEFLRARELEYVAAARALGFSRRRIMFLHILPNVSGPVFVAAAFAVAAGILTESAVSFLGFGVPHPIPSWGALIHASTSAEHWWVQLFPGLSISLTVICFNVLGEGLRDALDPRGPRAEG